MLNICAWTSIYDAFVKYVSIVEFSSINPSFSSYLSISGHAGKYMFIELMYEGNPPLPRYPCTLVTF